MARLHEKVLSILIALLLALAALPAQALAEMAEEAMGEEPAAASPAAGPRTGDANMGDAGPTSESALEEQVAAGAVLEVQDEPTEVEEPGEAALSTQSATVSNPRIVANSNMESGQVATWDCVWLGSYPQTEMPETDALRNASWIDGDATVSGMRYRRITRSDTTNSDNWQSDAGTYRYFRYEPIKWRILKVDGDTAYAVADVALDCRQYHRVNEDVTWEMSAVRSWLNGTGTAPYYTAGVQSGRTAQGFATVAFTSDQLGAVRQSSVVNTYGNDTSDKVFLLHDSEIYDSSSVDYGFASGMFTPDEARRCKATDFAEAMGAKRMSADSSYAGNCIWMPRSPVVKCTAAGKIVIGDFPSNVDTDGVRPALNLDLSSSQLSYAGTVSSDGTVGEVAAPKTFPDVDAGAWYAGVISRAVGLGLLSGYGNGSFGPNDRITRGQVAVVLWNMAGGPDAGARTFGDVRSGAYYYKAVRWASGANVISGYGDTGRFGPDDNVTREQLAVMLANYASNVAHKPVEGSVADYGTMKDKDKVSSWAQTSVGWCFRNQILSGGGGYVNPQGNATRAEASKMVVGLYDLVA